jgi:hypothetical protein
MFLSDVQCRYWVPAPAAWQQQPATTQHQQLVEFYVAFSTGHGKQLGATRVLRCIHADQWLKCIEFATFTYTQF